MLESERERDWFLSLSLSLMQGGWGGRAFLDCQAAHPA